MKTELKMVYIIIYDFSCKMTSEVKSEPGFELRVQGKGSRLAITWQRNISVYIGPIKQKTPVSIVGSLIPT